MRRRFLSSSISLALAMTLAAPASAAARATSATAQAERPLVRVDADPVSGKIVATFPKPDSEGISARYIYLTQLETGLGSAPIGLDRATANESRILVFRRLGKKVAAEVENSKFTASGTDDEFVKCPAGASAGRTKQPVAQFD